MKRNQIIQFKEQLITFLYKLRFILWVSVALSVGLFALSILLFYKKMLLSSVLIATLAFVMFRLLREYSVIITKKWMQRRAGQEEMLCFIDKEIKDRTPREFFYLLERAIQTVNGDDK